MKTYYRIECLQGAPFSSWDDPHTLQEIKEKFWDYASNEDMFDEVDKYYDGITPLIPDWFNLDLIQDIWEVEIVKMTAEEAREGFAQLEREGWITKKERIEATK